MRGAESPLAGTAAHKAWTAENRRIKCDREVGSPCFEGCALSQAPGCSRDAQYDCGNALGLRLQSPGTGNLQPGPTAYTLLRFLLYGHQSRYLLDTGRIQSPLSAAVWFDNDHIVIAIDGCRRRLRLAGVAGFAIDGFRAGCSSSTQEFALSFGL